jgi:hypothetical protein
MGVIFGWRDDAKVIPHDDAQVDVGMLVEEIPAARGQPEHRELRGAGDRQARLDETRYQLARRADTRLEHAAYVHGIGFAGMRGT